MAYFDNGNQIFADARANHYAVGAYNINNLEWTRAILQAANETRTPVLVQVSMGAAKYMGGFKFVRDMVADQIDAMGITVPVVLNLDHGDFAAAMECIDLGYSSVMYDGHKLPLATNYDQTAQIVQAAHQRGISVKTRTPIAANWLRLLTPKSLLNWELISWRAELGIFTEFTRQTGGDWTSTAWRQLRMPWTFRWSCTVGPESLRTRSNVRLP